jgi:hypothetical protein
MGRRSNVRSKRIEKRTVEPTRAVEQLGTVVTVGDNLAAGADIPIAPAFTAVFDQFNGFNARRQRSIDNAVTGQEWCLAGP